MKKMIATLLTLSVFTVSMAQTGPVVIPGPPMEVNQGLELIEALVNEPQIGEILREKGFDHIEKITQRNISPGNTQYAIQVQSLIDNRKDYFSLLLQVNTMKGFPEYDFHVPMVSFDK